MGKRARLWAIAAVGPVFLPGIACAQISQPKPGQGAPVTTPRAPEPQEEQVDPKGDAAIIPDAEFDAALPKLSDDINAPLEPMTTFNPPPTTQPLPTPEGTPVVDQGLPPVSIDEPEFTRPLPPLSDFELEPVATTDEGGDSKTVEIRYTTVVEGLDAIKLDGQFESFSALEQGDGRAANAAMVAARAREDEALAVRLMKSLGFYDATAVSTIEQDTANPGRLRAVITATPGQLYRLGAVIVNAEPTVPPGMIREQLNLHTGDPIEAVRVQGAEANVALVLPQRGYPFVEVGERDILLDEAAATGDYTLPVTPGPRASFGKFVTTRATGDAPNERRQRDQSPEAQARRQARAGRLAFDVDHIALLARFNRGQLYDSRKVDDLREALIATSLFTTVSVEPVKTGEAGPDGTEYVDLLVRQRAGPPRTLAFEGGYSTGQGVRVVGSWTHRNLFPPEGALILSGVFGTQEMGASATFRRSNWRRRDRTLQFGVSANYSDYEAYNAYTGSIMGRVSYESTPIWQKRWTYYYGFELAASNEDRWNYDTNERDRGTWFIAALPTFVGYDTSDDLLNPTKGFRLRGFVSPETSVRGEIRPYVRLLTEGTAYYRATDSIVLAGRVRVGSIMGVARNDLPPSRRVYSGGGGSVRGFGYQELGPRTPDDRPVGGRSVNEFAIEARYRFGNFGIVPFIDAGQVYESSAPQFSDLRFGAGIGGRFYTNFGPIRLDVATPIDRRPNESKVALYISIGQAF